MITRKMRLSMAMLTIAASVLTTGNIKADEKDTTKETNTATESKYANKAVADIYSTTTLNIRKKGSINAKIVGKMKKGNIATVLKKGSEWSKVRSGNVTGYVKNQYLVFGDEIENFAKQNVKKVAKVQTETLRVRKKASTDSKIVTLVSEDDKLKVKKQTDDWAKVKVDGQTGYVSKDYAKVTYSFGKAKSMKQIQAEQEAKKRAEEAARNKPVSTTSSSHTSNTGTTSGSTTGSTQTTKKASVSVSSSGSSATGSRIASYAQQFVGNPYRYGGNSLTSGIDCSGFTQQIMAKFGYSISRTSSSQSGDGRAVSTSNLRAGAAWVSTQFDTTAKNARKIQILVEEGQGGFAAISEVVPFTVQKVADAVTLDAENVTLKVGETVTLTPSATPEGAMLKGLVWSSSDEEIATVDENGVVTALKEGTATIKVSNVAGLEATCKVTVKGKAEQPDVDKEAPTAPGKLSKAEVTKDSIQIRWKKSKDNVGVEGYEIFLNGVSIKKVSADTTSVMISNLLAGTEYQITVKAYDAAGNYSEAAALTVKTLAEDKNNSGNKDDNQKPDSGNKNDGQKPSGDQNQNSSADKKPAGVPQVTVVKTGDSGAPIGIFVVLAIVAAGAVVVVVLRMKADQKKNAKKKHRNRPDGTR